MSWTRNQFLVATVLASLLLGGCATSGRIGPLPEVTQPTEAANVTVFRGGSWVGLFSPIRLQINGQRVFNIYRNEQYSFQMDPGLQLFEFTIGINECRRVIYVEPRRSYRVRLVPNCFVDAQTY